MTTAVSYIVGAVSSALAGFIGMRIAVKSNMRTASAARTGLNRALRVAFSSGGVMGITVVGIGLLGAVILWMVFGDKDIVAGFSFGASSIALFARVGGGIYTKAADVGGDLAGKVEAGIPEDDPRNAAVIADNVGDNVGDVAGMGADLFESYVGSIIASLALAATGVRQFLIGVDESRVDIDVDSSRLRFSPSSSPRSASPHPSSARSSFSTGETTSIGSLLWSLRRGIFAAGFLALIGSFAAIYWLFEVDGGFGMDKVWQFWGAVAVGLGAGVIIGVSTEYYTSYEYKPTRGIAARSVTGPATIIISGFATGMLSTAIPLIIIAAAVIGAHQLAGLLRHRHRRGRHALDPRHHACHRRLRPGCGQRGRHRRAGPPRSGGARAHRRARLARQHHRRHRQGLRHRLGGAHIARPHGCLRQGRRPRSQSTCSKSPRSLAC